jgi:hypothetical protein
MVGAPPVPAAGVRARPADQTTTVAGRLQAGGSGWRRAGVAGAGGRRRAGTDNVASAPPFPDHGTLMAGARAAGWFQAGTGSVAWSVLLPSPTQTRPAMPILLPPRSSLACSAPRGIPRHRRTDFTLTRFVKVRFRPSSLTPSSVVGVQRTQVLIKPVLRGNIGQRTELGIHV